MHQLMLLYRRFLWLLVISCISGTGTQAHLPRTYLAHHELESMMTVVIILIIIVTMHSSTLLTCFLVPSHLMP